MEILDTASDADICEESELTKFNKMLCDAQKSALAKQKERGSKRKTHNGCSRSTAYRRKRYRDDLAAKGYLPVHEFMGCMMKPQKNADELTPPQDLTPEESEEGSDDDSALWSLLRSSELNAFEGTNIEELTPAVSEDRCPFLDLLSGC